MRCSRGNHRDGRHGRGSDVLSRRHSRFRPRRDAELRRDGTCRAQLRRGAGSGAVGPGGRYQPGRPSGLASAPMTAAPRLPGLTLSDADQIVQTALEVGAERGFPPLAVAVIDVAGEVVVLRRSDGGMPMTSRIAVAKARSALVALKPSGLLEKLPPGIIDTAQHLYGGNFVPRAGGVLITEGDLIVGAAGASGAQSDEDEEAVRTAVERWQKTR